LGVVPSFDRFGRATYFWNLPAEKLAGHKVDVIACTVAIHQSRWPGQKWRAFSARDFQAEIERILARLGFVLTAAAKTAAVPASATRTAVGRGSCRLHGRHPNHGVLTSSARSTSTRRSLAFTASNRFPDTLPGFTGAVIEQSNAGKEDKVRRTLLSLGYNEALSSTFIAREDSQAFSLGACGRDRQSLSEEASAMRTSLLPGMVDMLARNLNRGTSTPDSSNTATSTRCRGRNQRAACAIDRSHLGGRIGARVRCVAHAKVFSTLRLRRRLFRFEGDLESLLSNLQGELTFQSGAAAYFHPGRSARALLNGAPVAQFGMLSRRSRPPAKSKGDILLAEVFIERLFQNELRVPRTNRSRDIPR